MTLKKRINKFVSILVLLSFITMPIQQYGFTADSVLPQGPQVVSGDATVTSDGTNMDITTSDKLIANWQSFSIGEPNAVHFWQPSSNSVALNRVLGGDASSILGTLTATGKIFLINQNGILFGANSHVNAAGLVASTLDISNNDFLAGRYFFTGDGGSVVNQGYISTPGGYTVLLGSHVENNGVIEAELGSIALAAARSLTLHLDPKGTISVAIDEALAQNLSGADDAVLNTGTLLADGGKVLLTAKALDGVFKHAVNNTGIIEANTLNNQNGEVVLEANQRVNVGGDISAEGGTVTVNSQGADFDASINASQGIFTMNDGDTYVKGGTYSGNMLWQDNANIYVLGDLTVNTGSLTFKADLDNDNIGDFFQEFGLIKTTDATLGDINISGQNITVRAISSAKDLNVNAKGDILIAPAWQYKEQFTIAGNFSTDSLLDFPVLINLNNTNFDFSKAATNGSDIRFVDANGNALSYEIQSWDGAGHSAYVWVKIPKVNGGSPTDFFMYHDNNAALPVTNAFNNAKNVWSNGYLMVQHFTNTNTDSTANGNNGTNNGVTFSNGAGNFNGSSYIDLGTNFNFGTGPLTIEASYQGTQNSPYIGIAGATPGSGSGYALENNSGVAGSWINNDLHNGPTNIADGNWHNIALVRNNTNGSVFTDGTGTNFTTSGASVDTATNFMIGGWGNPSYLTNGKIDEVRVSNVVRSDAWLGASYKTETGPTSPTSHAAVTTGLNAVGTVTLNTTNGAIVNQTSGTNITAAKAALSAANGIGSSNALQTKVNQLAARNTSTGNINIENTDNLLVTNVNGLVGVKNDAASGKVGIKTHSDLTIDNAGQVVTNGGDINLEANGNVNVHNISTDGTFTGSSIPSAGTVTVKAGGNIEDAADVNHTPIDNIYDISALNIILNAIGSIGTTSLAPIELRSNGLSITAQNANIFHKGTLHFGGFTGNTFNFTNAGDFYLEGNLVTTGGAINLSVIDDPNLFINAMIDSGGFDVNLNATNHIIHNFAGNVYTHGGNFTAKADSDANGSGTYSLDPVAVVDTTGALHNGKVLLSGNDMVIGGKVKAGDADVTIQPSSNQTIGLADGTGTLSLSDSEVDNIQTTGVITIGSNIAGDIAVDNLTQAGRTIKLVTHGSVNEQGSDGNEDITAGKLILDVAGSFGLGNAIETDIGTLEGTVGHTLNINEFTDLQLKQVTAADAIITLTDQYGTGGTLSGSGVGTDLTANTAILDAKTAINLNTAIGQLSARVRDTNSTGDLTINNTGALSLNNLAGWNYSIKNFGTGNVNITTASPINVNADVIANKNISLKANGATDGNINVAANITSNQAGTIGLDAAQDINHTAGNISTQGTVNETAGRDVSITGATPQVNGNDVNVKATRDIKMNGSAVINATNLAKFNAGNNMTMAGFSAINGKNVDIDTVGYLDMTSASSSHIHADQDVDIDTGTNAIISNSTITAGHDVYIDAAIGNITLGKIVATNNIWLTASNGAILDTSSNAVTNVTGNELHMLAKNTIGQSTDRIKTNVNDIWAKSTNNSIFLNELNGVNLRDVEALGSTVDIITGGDTYAYLVLANGTGTGTDDAKVNILVNTGSLTVDGATSSIIANQSGDNNASVSIVADNNINVTNGAKVQALANSTSNPSKTATVSLTTNNFDVNVTGANAEVSSSIKNGNATTTLKGNRNINVNVGKVLATSTNNNATVNVTATTSNVQATSSTIQANAKNNASIGINAGNNIGLNDTDVLSDATNGTSTVAFVATNAIDVLNTSLVHSKAATANALVNFATTTGDITVDNSTVEVIDPAPVAPAQVTFNSGKDIKLNKGTVTASNDNGATSIDFTALNNITLSNNSLIAASSNSSILSWKSAQVNLNTTSGDIGLDNSTIQASGAIGNNYSSASVNLNSGKDINLNKGIVNADAKNKTANVTFLAKNAINLANKSLVHAYSPNSNATVNFTTTNGDINMDNSRAEAFDAGGAVVTYDSGKDIALSNVSSIEANNDGGPAKVDLKAKHDVNIQNSSLKATAAGSIIIPIGAATINVNANNNIGLTDSTVSSNGNLSSTITFNAGNDISSDGSQISSTSTLTSSVGLNAGRDISLANSKINTESTVLGNATNTLTATNNIGLTNAQMNATALTGTASNSLTAGHDISLASGSKINANSTLLGNAVNTLSAINNISMTGASEVNANALVGSATNTLDPASITIDGSSINATALTGNATNSLTAGSIAITGNSKVNAASTLLGNASNTLTTTTGINVNSSEIDATALVGNTTNTLTASNGDITITSSQVNGNSTVAGNASNTLTATGNINLTNSEVNANALLGNATNTLDPASISLNGSSINATALTGNATNSLTAGNISMSNVSKVNASSTIIGNATNTLTATTGDINIGSASEVNANALVGNATNTLSAGQGISLADGSKVNAASTLLGNASNTFTATAANINITNGSEVNANALVGNATNTLGAGNDISLNLSKVNATSTVLGTASNSLTAGQDISILNNSEVNATALTGDATNTLSAGRSIAIDPSKVNATSTLLGNATNTLTATTGDIKVNGASEIDANALVGNATNTLSAGQGISLASGSKVNAASTLLGNASDTLTATAADISIAGGSEVNANALVGNASNTLTASSGSIVVTDSKINAKSTVAGNAANTLSALNNISLTNSEVNANALLGNATNTLDPVSISLDNSSINASTLTGDATNSLTAGSIGMTNGSAVNAESTLLGNASNTLTASDGISLSNASEINANTLVGNASNDLSAGADIILVSSKINATSALLGNASNTLSGSLDGIGMNASEINANTLVGNATNTLTASTGSISLINTSKVNATSTIAGNATNSLSAADFINLTGSEINASALLGNATNTLDPVSISLDNSSINASTLTGDAANSLTADSINLDNASKINAESTLLGNATNTLTAGDGISLSNASEINANTLVGNATNKLSASTGDIYLRNSKVNAKSTLLGNAANTLTAVGVINLTDSEINANTLVGNATNTLDPVSITLDNGSLINATTLTGNATNSLTAGSIAIDHNSKVNAESTLLGNASNTLTTTTGISLLNNSEIDATALVGNTTNTLTASNGSIVITSSKVNAKSTLLGNAANNLHAKDIIITKGAEVNANALVGSATNTLGAKTIVIAKGASVNAETGAGNATNNLGAKTIVIAKGGKVNASTALGEATNDLHAKDIIITKGAEVNANTIAGNATNNLGAKDIKISKGSKVNASSTVLGNASNNLTAGNNISITKGSEVNANTLVGNASNSLNAGTDITLDSSKVNAKSTLLGNAANTLTAANTISISNAQVTANALVGNASNVLDPVSIVLDNGALIDASTLTGDATNSLTADDISMSNASKVNAESILLGNASNTLTTTNGININSSEIDATALVGSSSNSLSAGNDISLDQSKVNAKSILLGNATNTLTATANNISIVEGSQVNANTLVGNASNSLSAGNGITLDLDSQINAMSTLLGNAANTLTATNTISITGDSEVNANALVGNATNTLDPINIILDTGSEINATTGIGNATNNLSAKYIHISKGSEVNASTGLGEAANNLHAKDIIITKGAEVNANALVGSATNTLGAKTIVIAKGASVNADAGAGIAKNNLGAKTIVIAKGGEVNASTALGEAANNLHAKDIIITKGAEVNANALVGVATNKLEASNDIKIKNSTVKAKVDGIGAATVKMSAGNDIDVDPSTIESRVNGDGIASVDLDAGNNLVIENSVVKAKVDGSGAATVGLSAGNDVKIKDHSRVEAKVGDAGLASVNIAAGDDIYLSRSSKVKAEADEGLALVTAVAGDEINARGKILAKSDEGYAAATLLAGGDIYAGHVKAIGGRDAVSDLESLLNFLTGDTIDIGAQHTYGSGILLGSLNGNITLGDISADAVEVSALNGSIYDKGDVTAHYLGLLARYDIGADVLHPINTNVDILSAYSWDQGNIFINEKDDIELGAYLPIFVNNAQWGALGLSVAANNGIIHITSGGDMVVNSVISPRGGVFLEATGRDVYDPLTDTTSFVPASIYAGRGWCPVVSERELVGFGLPHFILDLAHNGGLMDLSGTEWKDVAGDDYFTPMRFAALPLTGTNDLPLGPNVIAGGFSYISAPTGTIGVGAKNDPSVGLFDNPLKVDIQVLAANLSGGSSSALPGGGTSDAGLTIRMGGGQGSYDSHDGNGPLPVSGVIEGLVRPGTTAITGVYPSPAIDLSVVPPGYVFYNDTNGSYGNDCPGCSATLYGPSATNRGLLQIFPKQKPNGGDLEVERRKRLRAYYEILHIFRPFFSDLAIPTTFFGYHPLRETDTKQFDSATTLDTGAYEFIENNLEFNKKMGPFFGGASAPAGANKPNM